MPGPIVWKPKIQRDQEELEELHSLFSGKVTPQRPFWYKDVPEVQKPEPAWRAFEGEIDREKQKEAALKLYQYQFGISDEEIKAMRREKLGQEILAEWIAPGLVLGVAAAPARVGWEALKTAPTIAKIAGRTALTPLIPEKALGVFGGVAKKGIGKLIPKRPLKLETELPYLNPDLPIEKARLQLKQYGKELVSYIDDFVGKAKPRPAYVAQETLDKGYFSKLKDKWLNFVNRTFIVESKLRWLDGMEEGGVMWRTFYQPVNQARNMELVSKAAILNSLNSVIKENAINIGKVFSEKVATSTGKIFTRAERIGIFLNSLQKDNLRHITSKLGNNITRREILDIMDSLTPEEKTLAQWLRTQYNNQYNTLAPITKMVTGKTLKQIEGEYVPIMMEWRAQPLVSGERILAWADKMQFIQKWASANIPKGFTRPRTTRAIQPIILDAFEVFMRDLNLKSHYQAFAPVVRDLQSIMQNGVFKSALTRKSGRYTWEVMDEWLKQVADINPLRADKHWEKIMRNIRGNAVTAVLGFNIPVSFKQLPSFIAALPEIGRVNGIKGIINYASHPKETIQLIEKYSPQIAARFKMGFERELWESKAMLSAEKQVTGKWRIRDVFMVMVKAMDRTAVSAIWRGAFDANVSKVGDKAAAELAERAIRRTQPFFDPKDLAEYWRGGELARIFTTFTNQLNRYWNYYRFDIAGKYAMGKISEAEALMRVMETFVAPAFLIGAISRSRIPDDPLEIAQDFASMGLATFPMFGRFLSATMSGMGDAATDLISTEILDQVQSLATRMRKGDWGNALAGVAEVGGYAFGYPVGQPRRVINYLIDVANDRTDDWTEFIWGEFVRRKAKEGGAEYEPSVGGYEPKGGGAEPTLR